MSGYNCAFKIGDIVMGNSSNPYADGLSKYPTKVVDILNPDEYDGEVNMKVRVIAGPEEGREFNTFSDYYEFVKGENHKRLKRKKIKEFSIIIGKKRIKRRIK